MTEFQILIFSADGYSNGYDIQLNYFREKYKISQFVLVTIKRINHIANVKSSEYEKGVLKFRYPSKFHWQAEKLPLHNLSIMLYLTQQQIVSTDVLVTSLRISIIMNFSAKHHKIIWLESCRHYCLQGFNEIMLKLLFFYKCCWRWRVFALDVIQEFKRWINYRLICCFLQKL